MVKLSAKSKLMKKLVRSSDHVRRVRDRYARALAMGYSTHEAARLAHGDGEIPPLTVKLPAPDTVKVSAPAVEPPSVVISGNTPPKPVEIEGSDSDDIDEIPPNWQDLPWTHLKRLAMKISGRSISSRKDAISAIEEALSQGS